MPQPSQAKPSRHMPQLRTMKLKTFVAATAVTLQQHKEYTFTTKFSSCNRMCVCAKGLLATIASCCCFFAKSYILGVCACVCVLYACATVLRKTRFFFCCNLLLFFFSYIFFCCLFLFQLTQLNTMKIHFISPQFGCVVLFFFIFLFVYCVA